LIFRVSPQIESEKNKKLSKIENSRISSIENANV
jgi:hypothetical protein